MPSNAAEIYLASEKNVPSWLGGQNLEFVIWQIMLHVD